MNYRILGASIAILGILLMLTPRYIFPVCGMGKVGAAPGPGWHGCHGTMEAEAALGAAVAALGLVPIIWPRRRAMLTASLGALIAYALAIIFPLYITGLCRMPTMPCQKGTFPAIVALALLLAVAGIAGRVPSRRPKS
jgi:hypothetical protein